MRIREVAELLRQLETVSYSLGRDEILRHFNTTVEVSHLNTIDIKINVFIEKPFLIKAWYLMRCSSGDEHSVAQTLKNGIASHSIILVQSFPKFTVEIPALVVNRIVMRLEPFSSFQSNLRHKRTKIE